MENQPTCACGSGHDTASLIFPKSQFAKRHIGPSCTERRAMLETLGLASLEDLVDKTVPKAIRLKKPVKLPEAIDEHPMLEELRGLARQNKLLRTHIGMGFHPTLLPPVIQRNVLENPGWYTAYTPYQAEISQGRLECLLNFQTMVSDLTGLPIANASLLDEATACAEAMHMAYAVKGSDERNTILVADNCHPQNIAVIKSRAKPIGIDVKIAPAASIRADATTFAVIVQYPGTEGAILDLQAIADQAHAAGALLVAVADILALTLLKSPGECGADVCVGSTQRFGMPMGAGGPHAGFFATQDAFKRQMPGRLIGVSLDAQGKPALRLALQTREQHIRRDKATSNICTAQALPANISTLYAVYHGPRGLRRIATRVRALTLILERLLKDAGVQTSGAVVFDTLAVTVADADATLAKALKAGVNLRKLSAIEVGISFDETCTPAEVAALAGILAGKTPTDAEIAAAAALVNPELPEGFARKTAYLAAPVFNKYHAEHEMLRYLYRLQAKDLAMNVSMITLGSCTMKLNATAEMMPITWPEFANIHPFAPSDQLKGYNKALRQLEKWLASITGFAACSLQPNSGANGEYAGLLTIREYLHAQGQGHRNVCLIPTSAHGTNPASAAMCGFQIVPVAVDAKGAIDIADLEAKAEAHKADLAAVMITYPSTCGIFEEGVRKIVKIVHERGGQVYMDGANMNAQVGLTNPGTIGADVCHLNLHKTFAIPHGGGGPGVGPICVAKHLAPHLPGHPVVKTGGELAGGPVSSAPWGSALVALISWAYIRMLGEPGLRKSTETAILNANYIAKRLESCIPVLYRGAKGFVAHECILDFRPFKAHGVEVEDVAKRLMDYGFHAPTMSWPVPGTLMVEPTESESKEELDRFCDALIAIHGEIMAVASGAMDKVNNPLKNAPHTAAVVLGEWNRPYSRELAAFPSPATRNFKYWPTVSRVDNVYGDRNLVCTCTGMDAYATT